MRKLGEIYQAVRELKDVSFAEAKFLLSELEKTHETMLQLGDEFRLTRIGMSQMIKDIKEVMPAFEKRFKESQVCPVVQQAQKRTQ